MKTSGVIYSYQSIHRGRFVGKGLLFLSAGILLYLFLPIGLVELRYDLQKHEQPVVAEILPNQDIQREAAAHGLQSYFSIFVPQIDARANVIPNVSTTNEKEITDALMHGVAHAAGTYFPGQGKNIFLFAHSTDSPLNFTRYNAVFYLLQKLTRGDRIVLYFLNKKYLYEVQSTVITDPSDTSWLYKNFGTETLILQTCDPPGTTIRRLLVIATRLYQ